MARPWSTEAVGRFVAAAAKKAGSQRKLHDLLVRETGGPANPKSISDWERLGNAPGSSLFDIARLTQVSLDEYALGASLVERLHELEELVFGLMRYTGYDVVAAGRAVAQDR